MIVIQMTPMVSVDLGYITKTSGSINRVNELLNNLIDKFGYRLSSGPHYATCRDDYLVISEAASGDTTDIKEKETADDVKRMQPGHWLCVSVMSC